MKITKKDVIYISLIFLLALTFCTYNLRYRLLNTSIGKTVEKVIDTVNAKKNKIIINNETRYPKPSEIITEGEFKDLILKEVPTMNKNVSDLEKVIALREWVYLNVPTSNSDLIIKNLSIIHPNNIPVSIRIQIFREGLAGAWCGTSSDTLREIYDLFGFEAYNINQGDINEADTHVITIVKINHQNRQLFSVQDAYLNYYLSDVYGAPLSYFQVLSLLKAQRDKDIKIKWGRLDGRYNKLYLLPRETKSNSVYKTMPNGNIIELRKFDGYFDLMERFKPFLTNNKQPNDFLYIFLYPFGLYGKDSEKSDLLLNIAQRISEKCCIQNNSQKSENNKTKN